MHNLGEYKNTHSYLIESNRVKLACDYLIHEFRKIFPTGSKDEAHEAINKVAPNRDSDDVQIRDFWNLFSSICSGWRLKNLYNIVTNRSISWTKKDISPQKLYPESPLGWMEQIKPYRYKDAIDFLKEDNRANKELEGSMKSRGLRAKGDECDPIIVVQEKEQFKVVDGNSRLKLAIERQVTNNQENSQLKAWAGTLNDGSADYWIPTNLLISIRDIGYSNIEPKLKNISELALVEYLKRVKNEAN